MEPEQEPGGDLEYQVEIDFWDAVRGAVKKLVDHAHGYVRNVSRNRRGGIAANVHGVQWDGNGATSRGENAFQRAVLPLRRNWKIADHVPDVQWRRTRAPHGNGGRANSCRSEQRSAVARAG